MLNEQFIWLGAAVNFLAGIGYVMATVRGEARPNRVSWGLWSVTAWLAFFGQLSEGVGLPAVLTLTVALIPSLIFMASFVGGAYWEFSRLDISCGVFSLVTLVAWQLTSSGLVAIVLSIAVDALAGVPTIVKAYREPESESHVAYTAGMFSAACTLLTLTEFTVATAAFAIYFLTLCTTVSFLLLVTPRLRDRALRNSLRFPTTYALPRKATDDRLRDPFGPPVYQGADRFAAVRPAFEGVRTYRGIPHIDLEVRVRFGQLAHGFDARVPVAVPAGPVDLGRAESATTRAVVGATAATGAPGAGRAAAEHPGRTVEGTVLTSTSAPTGATSTGATSTASAPTTGETARVSVPAQRSGGPDTTTGPRAAAHAPSPQPVGARPPVGGPVPQATSRPTPGPTTTGPTTTGPTSTGPTSTAPTGTGPAAPTTPRVTVPHARPVPPTERIRPGAVPPGTTERLLPPGHPSARTTRTVPPPVPPRPAPPRGRPDPVPAAAAARRERARHDHGLFDPRYDHANRPGPRPPAPPVTAGAPRRRGPLRRWLPTALGTAATLGVVAVLAVLLVDVRPVPAPGGQAAAAVVPGPTQPAPAAAPPAAAGPVAASIAVPTVRGLLPVGATPAHAALAPDGRFAVIAHRGAGLVSVLDTSINKITATVAVPDGPPRFVSISPDSRRAYISVWNDERTVSLIAVLDTTTNTLVGRIPVGQRPFTSAVTPDGGRLWVPSHDDARIDIVDTAGGVVSASVPVPISPHSVAFSADGSRAFVATHESNVVVVLDTASATPLATVPVGAAPQSTAVAAGDAQVAAANVDSGTVSLIDPASSTVTAEVAVGRTPQSVAYAPDGRYLYTANAEDDTVSVVDTGTRAVTATIPVCDGPTSVAAHPSGRLAYVTCVNSGEVLVLDTTADQ